MTGLAKVVLRHPRKIVGFWVVLVLLGGGLASRLNTRLDNGGYGVPGSESAAAVTASAREFAAETTTEAYIAVLAPHASATGLRAAAAKAAVAVRAAMGVASVSGGRLSPDGRAILVPVVLAGAVAVAETHVQGIQAAIARAAIPHATVQLIGQASIYDRYTAASKQSLQRSSAISFPFTLLILLVAFLSVFAAAVPLCLAAVWSASGSPSGCCTC